jgi:urease accessory protein
LYLDDALADLAFVYLSNPTAGVLQGDSLFTRIRVRGGARAHVTTPAATKVFAMPSEMADLTTELYVESDGLLEFCPEPLIPFRGARLRQTVSLRAEAGATLFYSDLVAPGRVAHGETLAYTDLRCRLTVDRVDGKTLYFEAWNIKPDDRSPRGIGILGDRPRANLGTFLVVAPSVEPSDLGDLIRQGLSTLGELEDVRVGVGSLPGGGGVVAKALGSDTSRVQDVLRNVWGTARRVVLDADLPPDRRI